MGQQRDIHGIVHSELFEDGDVACFDNYANVVSSNVTTNDHVTCMRCAHVLTKYARAIRVGLYGKGTHRG